MRKAHVLLKSACEQVVQADLIPRNPLVLTRGVTGVQLATSDAHEGLRRAIEETFQGAAWQRCVVHLMRDCARAASGSRSLSRRVSRIVAPVFRLKEEGAVRAAYHLAVGMLESCCPKAAAILEEAEPDALAYLDFPAPHWKRQRTNNVQERTNRKVQRRSRVVQVFPSVRSLERLAGSVMCDQDEAWSNALLLVEGDGLALRRVWQRQEGGAADP